jgi:hypothetical protein
MGDDGGGYRDPVFRRCTGFLRGFLSCSPALADAHFYQTDSGRAYGAPQLLELEQHRQHAFEFSIEMDFVAGETIESVRIDGLAECLCADQRPVF